MFQVPMQAPPQIKSAAAGAGGAAVALAPLADFDIAAIASVVWSGRMTILRTTALSLLAAILFVMLAPHRYTAVTQILIDPTDLHAVSNELMPANQMSDAALLQVESQVRVLTSDSVLRRVIAAQQLDHDPELAGRPSALHRLLSAFRLGGGEPRADHTVAALNALRRSVAVRRAERTYVVDVTVTSTDPERAARLANAVAQAYLAEQTEVRSDAARQVSQSLSARLNELKGRVRDAEDRVEAFKARNNIVGASGQLVNEQQLSELNNQLGVARARTAQARALYEQIQHLQQSKVDIGAFPEAVRSPTITALRAQYAEVMRREAEQMTTLGARHPAVIDIQAQAARLKAMIEDEINRIALSARSEYESARANEDALARNLEALKHNTIATNEAMVTLRELERDVQANRAVYESFLVRARETGEQERLDTKNIRVISRADTPLSRSSPPSTTLLALAAIIFGVAAGTGIVIMRGPQGETAPPANALRALRGEPSKADDRPRLGAARPAAVPVLAVLPDVDVAFGLEAAGEPQSPFAKEIGKVHEAVWANHDPKRGNPSILVAAPDAEDDTATVAFAIAAMEAATQQVLLIDADLERRTLSAVDADHGEAGLVDVAVGRRRLSDAVIHDRATMINLLPFVSPDSRRDREIEDDDLKVAFAQTKHFDVVIVAAMDCDRNPSGRFFAGLVDHIVLVVRADAGESAVEQLAARFGLDARKIRGTVLTHANSA
jgi:polysaccharide biosynthesis transport protein